MFAAMAVAALIVYGLLGVYILQWTWVSTDRIWRAALIVSGAAVILL